MKFRILVVQTFSCLVVFFLLGTGCTKKESTTTSSTTPPFVIIPDPPQYETPFVNVPATSDISMYEINERAFSTSSDLAGIIPRLDSIKALGINVIWLMPIYPIGVLKSINSPYCVKNYREVNPVYGTLENLRTFVREAHNRNIAVILDWVANHTAWDNVWIVNKSWYTQDANGNIVSPPGTNWDDVADLNYDNQDMRHEMISCMKYWVLTANTDGYRCDAADYVPFDFWKQAIDSLKNIPNRKLIMLAEGNRADHFAAGFQMNYAWDFLNTCKSVYRNNVTANSLYQTQVSEYTNIPSGSEKLRFTTNHDEDANATPIDVFGGISASISAFIVTAYLGGSPLIYDGQEVGCPVKLSIFTSSHINWTLNPDILKQYKSLMQLRSTHPALRTGDLEYYPDNNVVAFTRQSTTDQILVIINTRSSSKSFTLPATIENTTWQDAIAGIPVALDTVVNLNAYEFKVLIK